VSDVEVKFQLRLTNNTKKHKEIILIMFVPLKTKAELINSRTDNPI